MNTPKNFHLLIVLYISSILSAYAYQIPITILQLNDTYEIGPVNGGKEGGLARVSSIRKELLRKNPHTLTVLSGDCVSPSALGSAKVDGRALAGKQMISVLNATGIDYATFGNHEFDLSQTELSSRIAESKFPWFSSNVRTAEGKLFDKTFDTMIVPIKSADGNEVRIGFIGVTITKNVRPYVTYLDPVEAMHKAVKKLKDEVDVIVALTHLELETDRKIADSVAGIDLILGGHEHENILEYRGPEFTPIAKADANARSVYIHNLLFDSDSKKVQIASNLQRVNSQTPEDPEVAKLVTYWSNLGTKAFRALGIEPGRIVATLKEDLDGLGSSVRNKATNLTKHISQAFLSEVPDADISLFNSGSIRIDDTIPEGPLTEYDIVRIVPFGGQIIEVEMKGELLKSTLEQGVASKGTGAFLQYGNIKHKGLQWFIKGHPLDVNRFYKVATLDFLLSGREQGFEFLKHNNHDIKNIKHFRDIRFALIDKFKSQ